MTTAYTKEEVREHFLKKLHVLVRYWATVPGDKSVEERCDGLAFSILNISMAHRVIFQQWILCCTHTRMTKNIISKVVSNGLKMGWQLMMTAQCMMCGMEGNYDTH